MSLTKPSALISPDFQFDDNKEPWASDTCMLVPFEKTQSLVAETAAVVSVQTYLKMANLPCAVKEVYNAPQVSPNGKLPVLKCGAYVVSDMEGVLQLAHGKGVSLSEFLNPTEKSDSRAYMSLVQNVLGNALTYLTWIDNDIYKTVTRQRVGSVYNFPLKYVLPWHMRKIVVQDLTGLKWIERSSEEVFREIDTCLLALSERLGETDYFFGGSATELDALVFGYLFTMMTTTLLKSRQLENLVRQYGNLVKFVLSMEKQYLPSS